MATHKSLATGHSITLALANMTRMHADLLQRAFHDAPGIVVAGHVAPGSDLATTVESMAPDIMLVGTGASCDSAGVLAFLHRMRTVAPTVKQIVMSAHLSPEDVGRYLRGGARGLLSESEADLGTLATCVRCVSMGQIWMSATQLGELLQPPDAPAPQRITNVLGASLLSDREEQVLELLASGMSNRELAAVMKLSEHTIKNHLFRIFDKLGVSNRLEAVLYAMNQRERLPAPVATVDVAERKQPAKLELATRCHSSRSHLRVVRANEC